MKVQRRRESQGKACVQTGDMAHTLGDTLSLLVDLPAEFSWADDSFSRLQRCVGGIFVLDTIFEDRVKSKANMKSGGLV